MNMNLNTAAILRKAPPRRMAFSALTLLVLVIVPPLSAQDAASAAEQIAFGKLVLPRAEVEKAYARIWTRYVYLMPEGRLERAGRAGARQIEGKVIALAGGRRAIIESGGRRYAVAVRFGANPVVGESIRLMAVPSAVPTFSFEMGNGQRESLPQFNDCTLSFDRFIAEARGGAHFPEAPELGTRPNRKGLFQIGRGDRNKVDGLVAERRQSDAAAAASSKPAKE